jgi:hypothetical protein
VRDAVTALRLNSEVCSFPPRFSCSNRHLTAESLCSFAYHPFRREPHRLSSLRTFPASALGPPAAYVSAILFVIRAELSSKRRLLIEDHKKMQPQAQRPRRQRWLPRRRARTPSTAQSSPRTRSTRKPSDDMICSDRGDSQAEFKFFGSPLRVAYRFKRAPNLTL